MKQWSTNTPIPYFLVDQSPPSNPKVKNGGAILPFPHTSSQRDAK
jgi:hypothetical protein